MAGIINNLDTNKNREYEYDALGRLTKSKGGTNNVWTQDYSYDRYGNRTNVTASGVAADGSSIPRDGIPNLTYNNTSNRITTQGFEYDVAGNQTRALAEDGVSWLRFEYDAANRLRVVRREEGSYVQAVQAFEYGASNARVASWDYQTSQLTIYAGTLAEYTEFTANVPTWTKSFTYLGDSALSTITPNGQGGEYTEYNHPDRLGTRVITNQQSGTSYEQASLPFGTALNAESTVSTNKKRFTSYDRSAQTGLDYAINRTYDSKQGRFTSVDPIGMSAASLSSPQTLNLYTYCGNDPINHTDPHGLFFGKLFKWIGKIFKAIVIVAAVVVAVVAIMIIAAQDPALMGLAVKALVWAGATLAGAFAGGKFGAIIQIVAGIAMASPGIIVNLSETPSRIARLRKLLSGINLLGAISNFFAVFVKSNLQGNCGVNPVTGKPGIKTQPYNEFGTLRSDSIGSGEWKASRGGKPGRHAGIDISGLLLGPVVAFRAGKITRAGFVKGYGNTIEITHKDGSVSKYHHLDSLSGKFGETVGEGVTVGFLGQTGNAGGTIPHVDFEIFKNGTPQNPVRVLNSPCD